jgi:hypothetical protein
MSSYSFANKMVAIASAVPDVAIQNAVQLRDSNTAFRITASHTPSVNPLTRQDYMDMVSKAFDNKFVLIADSLEMLDIRPNAVIVSGIIEANVMVKEFKEDEVRASMKVLAANVFQDNEDDIWTVAESNGTKHLVQSVKEDFARIVTSRLARKSSQVLANANYSGIVPESGDYIAYYNVKNQTVQSGFAMVADDMVVYDRVQIEAINITTANILEVVPGSNLNDNYSLAKHINDTSKVMADDMSTNFLQKYLQYARNLFGGTAYFEGLEKLVAKRRQWGNKNAYISTYSN